MSGKTNLELVYQHLSNTRKPEKLAEIWQAISNQVISQKKDKLSLMADLYGEMSLDNRFALTPQGLWALSIDTTEDIKKQLANFVDTDEVKTKLDDDLDELGYEEEFDEEDDEEDIEAEFYDSTEEET